MVFIFEKMRKLAIFGLPALFLGDSFELKMNNVAISVFKLLFYKNASCVLIVPLHVLVMAQVAPEIKDTVVNPVKGPIRSVITIQPVVGVFHTK